MYEQLKTAFIGLNTHYKLADDRLTRRIYLDSGASTLMLKPANDAVQAYLPHYANTHTTVHTSAKITSTIIEWAHRRVLEFAGADNNTYLCTFLGNGTTAAANRVAEGLAALRPDKEIVLISSMEHHSNDLPHRYHAKKFEHIPLLGQGMLSGQINLSQLENSLKKHKNKVNYVALTGVSNVTGMINPLKQVADLVHQYDAYLVVDGAQMIAHVPVNLTDLDCDFFLFSGHKIYAPGSPGVLIGKKTLIGAMPPSQFGGGMVHAVTKWGYQLAETPLEREYAGTPNIPGTIALACVLECISRVSMETIFEKEKALVRYALNKLQQCRAIKIYGEQKNTDRVASLSFNLTDIGHGLVAAILNDYHGIAVRNQCFCAHPYVQEMLTDEFEVLAEKHDDNDTLESVMQNHRGMVRASFGLYTTKEDIDALAHALMDIENNIDQYLVHYDKQTDGSYCHKFYDSVANNPFNILDELSATLPK